MKFNFLKLHSLQNNYVQSIIICSIYKKNFIKGDWKTSWLEQF